MRLGVVATVVVATGCAQVLGIHDRGGNDGSGSGSNPGSNCTSDYLDVEPKLVITSSATPSWLNMAALAKGAATPEIGIAWCESSMFKFATLGYDGTAGPTTSLGPCFGLPGNPIAVGATDSTFAADSPGAGPLYILDSTGTMIGSPITNNWYQAAIRGSPTGFVALAINTSPYNLVTQSLAKGATALTAQQLLPSNAGCCSQQLFDAGFDAAGDVVVGWTGNAGTLWSMDYLRAPGFGPDASVIPLPDIHGNPRLVTTSLGTMFATATGGYQFVTNNGDIGPLLPTPDTTSTYTGIAQTDDQIRISRPAQGVVSWHALDPSTGAGPELLSISTGSIVNTVISDNQHGFALAWTVSGGIGYAHVELCTP